MKKRLNQLFYVRYAERRLDNGNADTFARDADIHQLVRKKIFSMMTKEKSCGIVLMNCGGSEPKFLLLHYPQGHFDFPKGHVEVGENEIETASRELAEETGISDVVFCNGFREKVEYFFKHEGKLIQKEVYYFLAKTETSDVKLSHEHQGSGWFTYSEAHKKITFDQSRKVLEKAGKYLKINNN